MKKRILTILFAIMMICALQVELLAASVYETDENGTIIKIENENEKYKVGYMENMPIEVDEPYVSSRFSPAYWNYYADCPEVVGFFDYKDMYNVVYADYNDSWEMTGIVIKRYNSSFTLNKTISIAAPYALFGNIITDDAGNYYAVWGQCDTDEENCVVISLCKYDYNGKLLSKCEITGFDAAPYSPGDYWGTKIPFDAGNCSMSINNGVLACNFAREMYSGHQSNYAFYVNCETMERVSGSIPYTSHSFDQGVLSATDGGFLMLNHGDAFYRGFSITKIGADLKKDGEVYTFHFREGSDRAYGYNETYAQLGGIAETDNAYVFCASSERTLSIALAPTGGVYCGHSEARDLFIQILKKDFYDYSYEKMYLVQGATRFAIGTRPETTENKLYLNGDETDYGILWITDYDDDHYASNPHIVSVDDNRVAIMWEKRSYDSISEVEAYFAIMEEDGTYSCEPTKIGDVFLAGNTPPVYKDGKIYWTTVDSCGSYIRSLTVSVEELVLDTPVVKATNVENGVKLTWNKIDNAEGYYVYRKDASGNYRVIATISGGNTLNYEDTKVEAGAIYTYTVGAFNNNGNYVTTYYEDGKEISYIAAPEIIGFKAKSKGTIIIWNAEEGAECYRVFRKSNGGGWKPLGDTTEICYMDTTATQDDTYVYTVRCVTKDGKKYTSGYNSTGKSYTGMLNANGTWLYISDGKMDTSYTGLAQNDYGWWYMTDGKLDTSYTGLAQNDYGWWYITNGKLNTKYTGLVKYKSSWVYIYKGKLNASYTGLVKYKSSWVYVKKGKLDTSFTGMAENKYGWWYVTKGKLDFTYTGLARNKYGWWYMKNGALDLTYTGLADNPYGTWYLEKGTIALDFTGTVTIDGVSYRIKKGKVQK